MYACVDALRYGAMRDECRNVAFEMCERRCLPCIKMKDEMLRA